METIKETGKIIAVNENFVTVAVQSPTEDCHSCAMATLCTGGEDGQRQIEILRQQIDFAPRPGQKVELCFDRVLEYSILLYLIPMAFFLAALWLAYAVWNVPSELYLFLCSMGGLAVGFFALRIVNNLINKKGMNLQIKLVGEN
ncbi:SoxR reducing system RseC family protein [Calditrichota bacterium LG25]